MEKKIIKHNRKILYLLSLVIFILLLSSLYITFNMDEEFTMGLVHHNYIDIINVDNLDVHPPLYYLLLKLFLQITTFWTNSMFLKVIFSRIFSMLIGIILVYFLHKSTKFLNIRINWKIQLLFYLFIPSILYYLTTIRMYELAALFIVIEFYELIQSYNNDKNIVHVLLSIIFASLASYTHYFAAVSAGLFLFTFFITSIIYKEKKKTIQYFISGIVFILLYLPFIPFITKQFNYSMNQATNYNKFIHELIQSFVGVNYSLGIFRETFVLIIFISFIYIIIWSFNNLNHSFNLALGNILGDFILTLIFAIVMNVFSNTPFTSRYIYPVFSIYSFFIITIFYIILKNKKIINICLKILLTFMCVLLLFNSIKSTKNNINFFIRPSITLINNMHTWKTINKKNINVKLKHYPTQFGKPLYISQSAVYLNSIDKNIVIKSKDLRNIRIQLFGHDNKKLFNKLFNNIVIDK